MVKKGLLHWKIISQIAQEFISNTSNTPYARQSVYLYQNSQEIENVDNGVGYDLNADYEMSYGLKISRSVSMKWRELQFLSLQVKEHLLMFVCRY